MSIRKPDGVTCPVDMGDCSTFGEYANAFRVFADSEGELLLDFCVYSARENKAECVARVRVPSTFLVDIHERIGRTIAVTKANTNVQSSATPIYLFRRPPNSNDDDQDN